MEPRAVIDFESRSACSIRACGSWRYSLDPSTEVLCLGFRLPYWKPGRTALYHPAFPHLGMRASWEGVEELWDWILDGGLVEAHNAFFERGLWRNKMIPGGWPAISSTQWRCSAAKAASHALPRSLDEAVSALRLKMRKDASGHKVMMKLNKPRKPRKAERLVGIAGGTILWHESPELFDQLQDYCRQDVLVEEALSAALPDLSPAEQEIYQLDQTINERGFRLDAGAIRTALVLIASESASLNQDLNRLTGGRVKKATQRAQLQAWLETEGLYLSDTQAATVDAYLDPACREPIPDKARQALTILRSLGRSSTAKYESMSNWICPDDRAHGCLVYHGASPLTGDHECLTPEGWVRLDQWQGGQILCWGKSGAMHFAPATPVVSTTATLVAWKNQKVDQLSTAEHAMPVFPRLRRSPVSTRVWGGGFARKTVATISPGDRIPLCGTLHSPARWLLTHQQTRVLIMTQADGHFEKASGTLKFGFRKARKVTRCQELLTAAGIAHTLAVYPSEPLTTRIQINISDQPAWLSSFSQKTFSWDWLNCPAWLFFQELQLWDGSKSSPKGDEYTTTNAQNSDVVQAIAHLSRRTCGVRRLVRAGWADAFRHSINHDPAPVTFRRGQRQEFPTLGVVTVYCAQTPTGYFIVRRNGRAWITGNTGRWTGAGPQPQNLPKGTVKGVEMEAVWDYLNAL